MRQRECLAQQNRKIAATLRAELIPINLQRRFIDTLRRAASQHLLHGCIAPGETQHQVLAGELSAVEQSTRRRQFIAIGRPRQPPAHQLAAEIGRQIELAETQFHRLQNGFAGGQHKLQIDISPPANGQRKGKARPQLQLRQHDPRACAAMGEMLRQVIHTLVEIGFGQRELAHLALPHPAKF